MKQIKIIAILTLGFISCRINNNEVDKEKVFQIILTDTANNYRAKWDLDDFNYRTRLENLLGLSNLKNGADSLEIRLWYDFSFSNSQHLYTLKFIDTNCIISFFRVYPRREIYEKKNDSHKFVPFLDRVIDSSFSKTTTISKYKFQHQNLDSIWHLKSQSDLKISDSVGFFDCYNYVIEIADKKRLKYLRHHCSMGYYEKTKLKEILDFENFCGRIEKLAIDNNVYMEERFDQ